MKQNRSGEKNNIPFRSERYFCTNGVWYFDTRGGKQQGPYVNKEEMQGELMLYIQQQKLLEQSVQEPISEAEYH